MDVKYKFTAIKEIKKKKIQICFPYPAKTTKAEKGSPRWINLLQMEDP